MASLGHRLGLAIATNMDYDDRDFRAVIFSSEKLRTVQSVVKMLVDPERLAALGTPVQVAKGAQVEGQRIKYFTKTCFIRTADPLKKQEFERMKKAGAFFEYDVYVLLDRRTDPPLIFVAIPFAAMARELFGKIHEQRPDDSFHYHRPKLDQLVDRLRTPLGLAPGLKTVAVNWLIAGDSGRSDQITLRGADVVHSEVFSRITESYGNLALSLRKLQVRFDNSAQNDRLKLSFDRFGNYGVFVKDEGANLHSVFEIVARLRRRKLLAEESVFPVRNKTDEPLF